MPFLERSFQYFEADPSCTLEQKEVFMTAEKDTFMGLVEEFFFYLEFFCGKKEEQLLRIYMDCCLSLENETISEISVNLLKLDFVWDQLSEIVSIGEQLFFRSYIGMILGCWNTAEVDALFEGEIPVENIRQIRQRVYAVVQGN